MNNGESPKCFIVSQVNPRVQSTISSEVCTGEQPASKEHPDVMGGHSQGPGLGRISALCIAGDGSGLVPRALAMDLVAEPAVHWT